MKDIISMTVCQLNEAIKKGEVSPQEVALAYLERIEEKDREINAYITVNSKEEILKRTDELNGEGVLNGIPVAVKDNICVKGMKTTCASKMLADFIPPYNACAYEQLMRRGCVLLGKLNMDEFGMGATTETSYFGVTRNPIDTSRVPGGSSGGSAAAVKAGEAPFALGSDTGGSVRQPAAFCGVVGIKPTYGRVSRYGLVAFASSLDQIGLITKDIKDNALILEAISGQDSRDGTNIHNQPADFTHNMERGVKGLRVGLPKELFGEGLSPDIKESILKTAKDLEDMGAEVFFTDMSELKYALPAYYVLSGAEASSNLARFDGVRYGYRSNEYENIEQLYINSRSEGFGQEVKRRIMLGTFVLSEGYYDAYYKKALKGRKLVTDSFKRVFAECDILLTPVAPNVAYKIGEKINSPLELYMADMYTVPANIAGVPALSLPCGYNDEGLPIGLQLIGPHFSESLLYRVGYALENLSKGAKI